MGNSESTQALNRIQDAIGYRFRNQALLIEALTHGSMRAENRKLPTYERLEFLGDSVLQLIITNYLYCKYPQDSAGLLSSKRADLICATTQRQIAEKLNLQEYARLGASNRGQSPQNRFVRYDDILEALLGAIYVDSGGYGDSIKGCVWRLWDLKESTGGNEDESWDKWVAAAGVAGAAVVALLAKR